MLLGDLFKRLSFGPFSNIALGQDGSGVINPAKRAQVISYVNDGLLRLYTRFILREEEVIIKMSESRTIYTISSKNAVSYLDEDPTNPAYVIDTHQTPYQDQLIKILSVYREDGTEVPLNIDGDANSVFTPRFDQLQIPVPIEGEHLHVMIQSRLEVIPDNALDGVGIEVPFVLEQALVHYIAYLHYDGMNSQEHQAKASKQLTLYDNLCLEAIDRDLVNSSQSMANSKLEDRGFI
jgi:hypothetical protein